MFHKNVCSLGDNLVLLLCLYEGLCKGGYVFGCVKGRHKGSHIKRGEERIPRVVGFLKTDTWVKYLHFIPSKTHVHCHIWEVLSLAWGCL